MEKKFYLSQTDKKIAGVCGGLAEYFNLDSLVVRIFVFCAVFFWGLSIWFYILLWIFAPKGPDDNGFIS
ncbi:MAG: PspC domain-containing protein [Prevotella sp.]|nr:PspC domain-containing protein [Prevotella sp.]